MVIQGQDVNSAQFNQQDIPSAQGTETTLAESSGDIFAKMIAAGTYHGSDRKEFWNTHFREDCVVFDLTDFDYTRVVVDVSGAQELIDKLS